MLPTLTISYSSTGSPARTVFKPNCIFIAFS
jgi:hypothetical protein